MNTKELLCAAREFRDGIVGNEPSERMCFMVCAPLHGYLRFVGEDVDLIQGTVSGVEHYWLRLKNGDVLDPTADQFTTTDQPMPEIYIGKQPKWYRENRKKGGK